jgi:hypothetical protein
MSGSRKTQLRQRQHHRMRAQGRHSKQRRNPRHLTENGRYPSMPQRSQGHHERQATQNTEHTQRRTGQRVRSEQCAVAVRPSISSSARPTLVMSLIINHCSFSVAERGIRAEETIPHSLPQMPQGTSQPQRRRLRTAMEAEAFHPSPYGPNTGGGARGCRASPADAPETALSTVAANANATAATADEAANKRMRLTRVETAAVVKNTVPARAGAGPALLLSPPRIRPIVALLPGCQGCPVGHRAATLRALDAAS